MGIWEPRLVGGRLARLVGGAVCFGTAGGGEGWRTGAAVWAFVTCEMTELTVEANVSSAGMGLDSTVSGTDEVGLVLIFCSYAVLICSETSSIASSETV